MNADSFWGLIERARSAADDPADSDQVASEANTLAATRPREETIAANRAIWDLYRLQLWAAAYVINGGFDYFRGWLIMQGQDMVDRVLADPDSLADLPAIRDAAADGE